MKLGSSTGATRHDLNRLGSLAVWLLGALLMLAFAAASAQAVETPAQDPFYKYEGKPKINKIAPGTVLKTRSVQLHIEGIELPITAVQLLYRSTSELGKPTVNVTSVLLPPAKLSTSVISYQSFYDSLNTEDDPSYAIAGGDHSGGEIAQAESGLISPALLAGETVDRPRHRGRGSRLLGRPGLRLQHARLAACGIELAGDRSERNEQDRPGRLLGRSDRHRVGRRACAELCA